MAKLEVFVRTMPQTTLRALMRDLTLEAWMCYPGVVLDVIKGPLVSDAFQWESRVVAESRATGDFYVLADDDHMPLGEDWVEKVLGMRRAYPDYVMLSAMSTLTDERPPGWRDAELIHRPPAQGTPYIATKGAIPWTDFVGPANQQDQIVSEWIDAHGIQRGVMRDVRYLHLGYGYSQVQPNLWGWRGNL